MYSLPHAAGTARGSTRNEVNKTEVTIEIPGEVWETVRDGARCWCAKAYGFVASSFDGEKVALLQLRKKLLEALAEQKRAETNHGRVAIGTVDGKILLVEWREDTWGYTILSQYRNADTTMSGFPDIHQATTAARVHARRQFGGIAWEGK